ncbi:hypothetical protein D9619_011717 [Psilocybe cf. subviscida]|uniref:Uncharacterized protein n=1 Tax=Psilocybe cf. subviscida TaxID=2480587 RepID=A0A8H5F9J1_9AGAR|nr:hypothetical protein D9619_011717 [Psilocybe cf. subviscida]
MHLLPEFVCDFDSLIESDFESEEQGEDEEDQVVGSDIEIDFNIASSSPIQLNQAEQALEETGLRENGLVGYGHMYAPCDAYRALALEDDDDVLEVIDIDIFDDTGYYTYGLDEDDGCDADVSSELDILEADANIGDSSMDIDTASSTGSCAEFRRA